ncbi:MAG: leucine-rich repeat protein, partial [Candidatus Fibromonas sp.]|nr:leucine-rich repeat protein [Candidatus Fibromonas sp.]
SIAAELVNDKGKAIGKANFQSEGSWWFNRHGRPEIYISDDDRKQVKFASVSADDITDRITIRIESVNGTDANTAAKTGVLQVKAISEAQWNSYVSFRMGRGGITGYNGGGGSLVIPDSIWNEPITAIGEGIFSHKQLTGVTIPNSVTFIGNNAFGSNNITNITIGKNVKIHENTFDNKFSEFYKKERLIAGKYAYYGSWEGWMSEEVKAAQRVKAERARAVSEIFTDSRDGKKYRKVKIGKQTWMAENLNYDAKDSKCLKNEPANCQKYGRLYNWATAKKVCPSGWHLPSKSEWEELDKAVGGEKVAGKKLKADSGWDYNGTDEVGFSALPGGHGNSNGSFVDPDRSGYWWSASEHSYSHVYYRSIYFNKDNAYWLKTSESSLVSVRCIQD